VTFADNDPRALKLIAENLQRCGASDRYAIIRFRFVPRPVPDRRRSVGETSQSVPIGPFDLAVLDPPYDEPDLMAAIAAVEPLMAPDGLMVLEHARRRPTPEAVGSFVKRRDVIAGDSGLAFYTRATTGPDDH
jgi:16S rRNA G966 N2-methylase RsmD